MRKLTKVLAMVLALVVMISAIPVEASAAVKTITLSSKSYKKVSYVKKTGEYQLKFRCKNGMESPTLFVAFTAPSKGTYVIQLSKLYLKGQTIEESLASMGVSCYSEYAFTGFESRFHDAWFDENNPVFIQTDDENASFGSSAYWEMCYDPETGESMHGYYGNTKINKSLKVKCRLKKGESVYFEVGGLSDNDWSSNYDDDKTGYCTMTIEKR